MADRELHPARFYWRSGRQRAASQGSDTLRWTGFLHHPGWDSSSASSPSAVVVEVGRPLRPPVNQRGQQMASPWYSTTIGHHTLPGGPLHASCRPWCMDHANCGRLLTQTCLTPVPQNPPVRLCLRHSFFTHHHTHRLEISTLSRFVAFIL